MPHVLEPLWGHLDGPSKRQIRLTCRSFRSLADNWITQLEVHGDQFHHAHGLMHSLWKNVTRLTLHLPKGETSPSRRGLTVFPLLGVPEGQAGQLPGAAAFPLLEAPEGQPPEEAVFSLLEAPSEPWHLRELHVHASSGLLQQGQMAASLIACLPRAAPGLRCLSLHGLPCNGTPDLLSPLMELRCLASLSINAPDSEVDIVSSACEHHVSFTMHGLMAPMSFLHPT